MELLLVRHAESESNVSGLWQGQGDSPLSAEGRRQADALAERLTAERFDLVVASDLSRAADTARATGADVRLDRAWREVDVGDWEGLSRPEVAERFPEQVEALRQGSLDVAIGGGESWNDMHRRVDGALDDLRREAGSRARVLVVSHGGMISGLVMGLLGIRGENPRPIGRLSNTSVTRVSFFEQGVELQTYNDATHAAPVGPWAAGRRTRGDVVVTLVAHVDGSEADPASFDRLGSRYRDLRHVYATTGDGARDAGAALAHRAGVPLSAPPAGDADLGAAVASVAERHAGTPFAVVADAASIASYASGVVAPDGGRAALGAPAHAAIAHVVVGADRGTLADYNLSL